MNEQAETATPKGEFYLPVGQVGSIYIEDMQKAVANVVTPYADAKPGDIISILTSWSYSISSMKFSAINQFLRITESGEANLVSFTDLPEFKKAEVARVCMDLQADNINRRPIERLADIIDYTMHDETFSFDVFLLHDLAIIQNDDPVGSLFDGLYYDDDLEQAHINKALKLLIFGENLSNHEMIKLSPSLKGALDLVNAIFPVPDDNGNNITLKLPKHSAIGSAFDQFAP